MQEREMNKGKVQERFTEIETIARAAGLDPYDVLFLHVPSEIIYQVASYGLPTRFSHWSFGRVYKYQRAQGEMGYSKIYELILNNDPSYAFLDKDNTDTINLLIAAHCLAHADVFKNNVMFHRCGETKMIQVAKRHAEVIDNYRRDYGEDEVDAWLDIALSLEKHIDIYRGLHRDRYPQRHVEFEERTATPWEDIVDRERKPLVEKRVKGIYLPPQPEKDLLWFLTEYANLELWQQRIFEIVRRESYYFYPQHRTKILNEGWACLSASSKVLTEKGLLSISEYVSDGQNILCHNGDSFVKKTTCHVTDKKPGLRITTSRGIIIEGAMNHRIMLKNEAFVKLNQLQIGDELKLSYGQDKWNRDFQKIEPRYKASKFAGESFVKIDTTVFDEDLARFVAFWIGEGCTSKDRGVYIRNKDLSVLKYFQQFVKLRFGLNSSIVECKSGNLRYNLEIYSKALYELLGQICGGHSTSRYKRIPEIVFRSPKSVVMSFLRSLFDAEGCVYDVDCKDKRVIFTSSSKELIHGVSLLLSNVGILANLAVNKKAGYEDCYQLIILISHLKLFGENVGFNDPRKLDILNEVLQCSYNASHVEFIAKVKWIEEIEDVFYDFTVPETHQYVANSLIHHNSFWHAELMRQYAFGKENDYGVDIKYPLTAEEHLDFVAAHEKVVQPGPKIPLKVDVIDNRPGSPTHGKTVKTWDPRIMGNPRLFNLATRINPYYVGFRIFRDIKERWDEYYKEGCMIDEWDNEVPVVIDGNQKIRQVMMEEDDISFLRNYLTEDLVDELHLFGYGNTKKFDDNYEIQEAETCEDKDNSTECKDQFAENKTIIVQTKDTKKIIQAFAVDRNNYGVPAITVRRVDESGMLRLEHLSDDKVNIDIKYAEKVLEYVWKAWGRIVELVRKEGDKTWTLTYDGLRFEVDHQTPDYPECIEEGAPPSSW